MLKAGHVEILGCCGVVSLEPYSLSPSAGSHKTSLAVDNQLACQGFLGVLSTKHCTDLTRLDSLLTTRESGARVTIAGIGGAS